MLETCVQTASVSQLTPRSTTSRRSRLALISALASARATSHIAATPVATFSFQDGGIWVGPSVALAIANRTNIGFGLTTGVEYNVNQQIMVFGGLYLGVVPSVAGIVTAGVNHQ